jgi:hypothetical protein
MFRIVKHVGLNLGLTYSILLITLDISVEKMFGMGEYLPLKTLL